MINISVVDHVSLIAFWLCFTRWLTILFQFPIFENAGVPSLVKVLSALIISYAFFPHAEAFLIRDIELIGSDNFWLLTIFNTIAGLLIGYLVKAIMNVFILSGSLISQQIGLSAVSSFDPTVGQQIGPFAILFRWTVVIMILTSGALLPMFKGALATFQTINLYSLGALSQTPEYFFNFVKNIFLSGLLLASPIVFTNLIMMSVMGVIAKMVPQMNILMVSFVVNIGIGLLVFTLSSNEFFNVAFKIYSEHLGNWFQFIT